MKPRKAFIFLTMILSVASEVRAQTSEVNVQRKFCGSGFTQNLVPDAIFGCELAKSCEEHDKCYSKCEPGQPMAGSAYCEKSEFSLIRLKAKSACDAAFLQNIKESNEGKRQCAVLGSIYTAAVIIGGQGPFNGRRIDQEGLKALIEISDSHDEAVAIFRHIVTRSQKGEVDLGTLRMKQNIVVFEAKEVGDGPTLTMRGYLKNEDQLKQLKQLQELIKQK